MSQALKFLILTTAGWLDRQQEDAIDYLREENRVPRDENEINSVSTHLHDGE